MRAVASTIFGECSKVNSKMLASAVNIDLNAEMWAMMLFPGWSCCGLWRREHTDFRRVQFAGALQSRPDLFFCVDFVCDDPRPSNNFERCYRLLHKILGFLLLQRQMRPRTHEI